MALRLALADDLPLVTSTLADPVIGRRGQTFKPGWRIRAGARLDGVLGRRLLVLVVVLMGLTALAASVAPRDGGFNRRVTSQAPAASPTAPPAGSGEPEASAAPPGDAGAIPGEPPVRVLDASGRRWLVDARVGERVRLEITADEPVTVQVGDDGPIRPVDPDAPARFDLLYDQPSREAVRVIADGPASDRTVGVVRIR